MNVAGDKQTLGVAIIGSGLMAKAHTLAWRNLQAVYGDIPFEPRLIMLVDATEELAEKGRAQLGYELASADWADAVAHPDVDIIDIVSPNDLHRDVAIAAARAGKHIWCEKPLALNADDAHSMVIEAEKAGVHTLVGFSYLHNPGVALAKRLIDEGRIGELVSMTGTFAIDAMSDADAPFSWRQERARAGSGALGDVGAHLISLARHLAGDITEVFGHCRTFIADRPEASGAFGYGERPDLDAPRRTVENDDIALFMTKFANGAVGSFEATRIAHGRPYEIGFTITGTQGAIRFDQQHMYRLLVRTADDTGGFSGFREVQIGPGHGDYATMWPVPGVNLSIHDLKFFELRRLIDALAGRGECTPDFTEGWEVQKVLDAVEESQESGAWKKVGR